MTQSTTTLTRAAATRVLGMVASTINATSLATTPTPTPIAIASAQADQDALWVISRMPEAKYASEYAEHDGDYGLQCENQISTEVLLGCGQVRYLIARFGARAAPRLRGGVRAASFQVHFRTIDFGTRPARGLALVHRLVRSGI